MTFGGEGEGGREGLGRETPVGIAPPPTPDWTVDTPPGVRHGVRKPREDPKKKKKSP